MVVSQKKEKEYLSQEEALIYDWRIHSIRQALKKKGKSTGTLQVEDLVELGHLDQFHYFGSQACDRAIEYLGIQPEYSVLDIGSGVGGPARYMSYKTGCRIQCIDLREDFNEIARDLTERAGFQKQIQYLTGDILSESIAEALSSNPFDSIFSFLCFLHIEKRDRLLEICFRSLKEGGYIYVEDYVANCVLDSQTQAILKEVVQAYYVPTRETYRQHLERAGFADICFIDLTIPWKPWVEQRYQKFIQSREESLSLFGREVYEHRSQFYQTICELFQGGKVGGSLIVAKKPSIPKLYPVSETYFSSLVPTYSEQYHFFLEDGSLLALRYFRTGTLEHYSAWWCDKDGKSLELLNTCESQKSREHISIKKENGTGTIDLPEANLEIHFQVAAQFTWEVSGEQNRRGVIHQPQLLCTVQMGDRQQQATGYCKIYEGNYPKFWGYHFVHAFFPNYGIVWSADATFGQEKYNYFKLLDTQQTEAQTILHGEDSYHRQTSACTRINDRSYYLKFDNSEFATWSSILRNRTSTMESELCLQYKSAILEIEGQKVAEGTCLKESCFGTIA
ncbi:MAG: methyltransferase domain-containing protein [Cyanobacteria bacterium SBLK]|nr:methyltransferase domain-containing protein [Cyanobacteria bacterium SBLK]